MNDVVYLSRAKFKELSEKLHQLKTVEFPENRAAMSSAVETGGGMHDNAPYRFAAEKERLIQARISELEGILSRARIIDASNADTSVVRIGTTVTVKNLETSDTFAYIVAGAYETDLDTNRVSYQAPVAKALLGKKVNDTVEMQIPAGRLRLRILLIERTQE